jgi:hypothetical protein
MAKPDVTVPQSNGNLGRVAPAQDGISALVVSGIAVAGKFALGDVLGPFTSPADAILLGIDAAYDTTNTCLAYKHILDFYDGAGLGTELYVMVVAKTVTMTQASDKANTYAKKLLVAGNGRIRLLGITRCPDGAYTPTYADQFEQDLWDAIDKLILLRIEEYNLHRPVSFMIEGRNFQGNASSSLNMRDVTATPNANRVLVVMGNDNDFVVANAYASKYSSVGFALGIKAGRPVQRNLGRVKDGRLELKGFGTPGFSNGAAYDTLTETNTDSLHDHGFVFFRKHTGLTGTYFNDDCVAVPLTDDYSSFSAGCTMDKVARIARQVYLDELLDDIELDPSTGKLAVSTIKYFQSAVEEEVNRQMTANKEIVRISAYADPNQNVTATDQVKIEIAVRRKGMAKDIKATLGFEAQSN